MADTQSVYSAPGMHTHKSPYRQRGEDGYLRTLQRLVDHHRYFHVRVTILRLRAQGIGSGVCELLVRRALGHMGYCGILADGDVVLVRVGEYGDTRARDEDLEREMIAALSDQLTELCVHDPDLTFTVTVAHAWSDEIWDAQGLVKLVSVLPSARARITPRPEQEAAPLRQSA